MKKSTEDSRFQTHIAEPRWQQIASVVIVLALLGLWAWVAFIHK
jgi:hypothetical protein